LRQRHGDRYRWLVLLTVMVGMMASFASSTIVNVAIPDMSAYFRLGQEQVQWVSAGFMFSMTLSLALTPWLLARYGLRRTYSAAVLLLAAGGIAGGVSPDFSLVVAARIAEGFAAGVLQPIPNVVILRGFGPSEQGRAIGIFGFGVVLAPALGPTMGGFLVEHLGWRSIFFFMVPFSAIALEMARRYLPAVSSLVEERRPFDWIGLACLSAATLFLLGGLAEVQHGAALLSWGLLGIGALGFGALVAQQLRSAHPLLHLRLFAHRQFAMGAIVAFAYGIGIFGSTYLLPLFLQMALRYAPSASGLVLLPAGLALAIVMPLSGRLADRFRPSLLAAGGMLVLAASLALTAGVDAATPYAALVAWVVLGRVGMGFILPGLSLGMVRGLAPADFPQAASMSGFIRQLGGAIGVSLVGTALEWRLRAHGIDTADRAAVAAQGLFAFQEIFLILAAVAALAVLAAWFMRPRAAAARVSDS
jgi:MFS transporter, DHA2 family, multidrug resistance protein